MNIRTVMAMIGIAGIVIGVGIAAYRGMRTQDAGALPAADSVVSYTAQENADAGVTVVVTPKLLSEDAATWEFDVVLSTHTQELGGYDLKQLATLTALPGSAVAPLSWIPDTASGHHIGGVLQFARIADASAVELRISGVGGASERLFRWDLSR